MIEIVHGQRLNLSKDLNELKKFRVEISYNLEDNYSLYGSNILVSAFCLNKDKKIINEYHLINTRNNKSPCNGVTLAKSVNSDNKICFFVDFEHINNEISSIIFSFSLEKNDLERSDSNNIFKNLEVDLTDLDKRTFIKFKVPLEFSIERTFEVFEIYKKDFEWKVNAQYYGYVGGMSLLLERYGLILSKDYFLDSFEVPITKPKKIDESLAKEIATYQQKLLDLSKKNPLINLKLKSFVEFNMPNLEDIFTSLVENNKTLTLYSKPEEDDYILNDNEILIDRPKKELNNLLYTRKQRAVSSLEEQGINILFISMGLLTWKEMEDSEDKFISPLILVPVEIEKVGLNSPYKIKLLDDDITGNPALKLKIFNQFGIELPDIPEDLNIFTVKDYFRDIEEKFKNLPNFILESRSGLGIFSFNKLVIYNDLELYQDLIQDHPLLSGTSKDYSENLNYSDYKAELLDTNIKSLNTFQVLDADSSQQEAIVLAKKGVSFVLQGPPGTGKSQTITNIISECLSDGKSVLFVSEKMAALDVVKKRLANAELNDFCLEIHSNKTSKKIILDSLDKSIKLQAKEIKVNIQEELDKLDEIKSSLNSYIKALHKPFGKLGLTPYQAQSKLASLINTDLLSFDIPDIFELNIVSMNRIQENLKHLSNLKTVLPDIDKNPWKNISLEYLTVEQETRIKKNIDLIIKTSSEIQQFCKDYELETSLKAINTLSELSDLIKIVGFISTTRSPLLNWLEEDFDLEEFHKNTCILQDDSQSLNILKTEFLSKYKITLLDKNIIDSLNNEILSLYDYFGKNIPSSYWKEYSIINDYFEKFLGTLSRLENNFNHLHELTSVNTPINFIEIDYLIKLFDFITKDFNIQSDWFEEKNIITLLRKAGDAKNRTESFKIKVNNFSSKYNKELLDLDITELLKRFENNYSGMFSRMMNSLYKADLKQITDLINIPKLSYLDALDILKKAEVIYKDKVAFDEEKLSYMTSFGDCYNGDNTDWDQIITSLRVMLDIVRWFSDKTVPDKLKKILVDLGFPLDNLKQNISLIKEDYSGLKQVLDLLRQKNLLDQNSQSIKLSELKTYLESKQLYIKKLHLFYTEFSKHIEKEFSWEHLHDDLSKGLNIIDYEIKFYNSDSEKIYLHLFNGLDTDWNNIIDKIDWCKSFKTEFPKKYMIKIFGETDLILNSIAFKDELYYKILNFSDTLKYQINILNNCFKDYFDLFNYHKDNLTTEPVDIKGTMVSPRDVFHKVVAPKIDFPEDKDLVVLRTTCKGLKDGVKTEYTFEVIDFFDEETGFTAMERTTAYPASIVAIMMAKKEIPAGAISLESAVPGSPFVKELKKRGIKMTETVKKEA